MRLQVQASQKAMCSERDRERERERKKERERERERRLFKQCWNLPAWHCAFSYNVEHLGFSFVEILLCLTEGNVIRESYVGLFGFHCNCTEEKYCSDFLDCTVVNLALRTYSFSF